LVYMLYIGLHGEHELLSRSILMVIFFWPSLLLCSLQFVMVAVKLYESLVESILYE
jgi:hypothetical protein